MKFSNKALLRIVITALLIGLVVGYVLLCAFFLLCSWVAKNHQMGCIGLGMVAVPVWGLSIFGK